MLRPISFEGLDETLPILSRGFPAMRAAQWTAALARLRRSAASSTAACAAYLLEEKGRHVGVMLAIPSPRSDGDAAPRIVNLSSWYVDPEQRWRAPRMLQSIAACAATLYTDLTPSPSVRTMISRLGFQNWTEGTLIFPLPAFAIRTAGASRVVPLHALSPDAFADPVRRIMDDHAALDCVVGGLWDGAALRPLIFSRKVHRGVPVARLIFADDRAAVFAHIPAISRFLLRERFALLAINGNRRERIAGSIFTKRAAPTFYKGPTPPAPCDFTYSEFVFLQV
ncbi:MAG: hypothetical protein AB7V13_27610 [Pseudorhodoplanes sp.]|uniref:hypothetical protein n=1 Tax=Pseudorhodoplanes sp. TaxID=1934341 RepID=UPI003D113250